MHEVVFIGDDITAIGFRLAGVHSIVPRSGELADVVARERSTCRVLVITAALFGSLPTKLGDDLKQAMSPLLAIVPDARRTAPVPDLERQVRRALGIEV